MKKIIHVIMAILCALGLTMQETNMIAYAAEQHVLHVETPYGVTSDPDYKWAVEMTEYTNTGYNVDVYAQLTINGQKVYCIDPLRSTIDGAGDYSASSLGEYTGNPELNQKLGYINALGYGYNGDTSDVWILPHRSVSGRRCVRDSSQTFIQISRRRSIRSISA